MKGGTNYNAISEVYGKDFCNAHVKGCQWHFKNDVIKKLTHIPMEYRDMFKDICHQLCVGTTISKYNVLKAKLDRMVPFEKEPYFWTFQNTWSPWSQLGRTRQFSWKPKKPLQLVHAAKNDTATMVLQEEELYEFMRNMTTSTSKGPLDAIFKAQWRVEQLNVAKDFVEIFDNIEAVMLESQEANQPSSY